MGERRRTSTSNFVVGRRESHDSTAFYERFRPPELSAAQAVLWPELISSPFIHGDARKMDAVADGSVAQPGGRIAVNIANLGRKPYRSLSSDVIRILQDELGLLLRGELIW